MTMLGLSNWYWKVWGFRSIAVLSVAISALCSLLCQLTPPHPLSICLSCEQVTELLRVETEAVCTHVQTPTEMIAPFCFLEFIINFVPNWGSRAERSSVKPTVRASELIVYQTQPTHVNCLIFSVILVWRDGNVSILWLLMGKQKAYGNSNKIIVAILWLVLLLLHSTGEICQ